MRLRASIFAVLIAAAPTGGAHAQMPDPYFPVAERVFMGLDADTRLWFQLFLTSAGHWPAVPSRVCIPICSLLASQQTKLS